MIPRIINIIITAMKIYVDGELSTGRDFDYLSSTILNDNPVRIGGMNYPGVNFVGYLDDVKIYDKKLSSDEIAIMYYGFFRPIIVKMIVSPIIIIDIIVIVKKKYNTNIK